MFYDFKTELPGGKGGLIILCFQKGGLIRKGGGGLIEKLRYIN